MVSRTSSCLLVAMEMIATAQHPWRVGFTVITWLTLPQRMMKVFSLPCLLSPSSFLAEDIEGADPLNDDKGRNSHQVLPASAVECQVVVTGGDGDGDQVLLLVPVSSTPAVVVGLDEDVADAGLLDDEGHGRWWWRWSLASGFTSRERS